MRLDTNLAKTIASENVMKTVQIVMISTSWFSPRSIDGDESAMVGHEKQKTVRLETRGEHAGFESILRSGQFVKAGLPSASTITLLAFHAPIL